MFPRDAAADGRMGRVNEENFHDRAMSLAPQLFIGLLPIRFEWQRAFNFALQSIGPSPLLIVQKDA
jgi:hypothetical protein